jgi:hypothetical protein
MDDMDLDVEEPDWMTDELQMGMRCADCANPKASQRSHRLASRYELVFEETTASAHIGARARLRIGTR